MRFFRGFLFHFRLTFRLNFRSPQAVVYGYLVPVLFLVAFGAVFRSSRPPLWRHMAQIVTISALGGACFGLPTTLVAERERGWWRRYRLLPRALGPLLASTLLSRFVLIASAAVLQMALARYIYGTPWPAHGWILAGAYVALAWAFLGLGLVVAGLAPDVPAVQALGQCLFLPMILIGGVGIPLEALPAWAQRLACFFPGRYAVEALGAGYTGDGMGRRLALDLTALAAIGAAAAFAGMRLFRWEPGRSDPAGRRWLALALVPWLAVGLFSISRDRWRVPADPSSDPAVQIGPAQIDSISYADLPPDDGIVTPLAPSATGLDTQDEPRLKALRAQLLAWAPGNDPRTAQAIRNLLCVAAIADVAEDPQEGEIARLVFNLLCAKFSQDELERGLAWVAIFPEAGTVAVSVPGLDAEIDPETIRLRDALYARKFLGRIRGYLAD